MNRLPQLAEPLLQFDLQKELQQLRHQDSWQRESGRSSRTLAKYPDFRIVLVLMKAGTQMNEHQAEGRVSIHHLLGKIRIHLPDKKVSLSAGQLLVWTAACSTTLKLWKKAPSCSPSLGQTAYQKSDARCPRMGWLSAHWLGGVAPNLPHFGQRYISARNVSVKGGLV